MFYKQIVQCVIDGIEGKKIIVGMKMSSSYSILVCITGFNRCCKEINIPFEIVWKMDAPTRLLHEFLL